MKWGQRFDGDEEVPEELRGKSPAEVAATLKKAKELEIAAAADKTAREAAEALSTTRGTEIDAMKARMLELEANQKPLPEPVNEEPVSPWIDPEKFVQKQTEGTQNTALVAGYMAAKMYFMQNLNPRDIKIFRKYEKEVDTVINTVPAYQRVMPQTWFNMFMFVKGNHEMDIQKAEASKTDFFSETPSRGPSEEPAPEDTLSSEEEEVCKTFHFDPKNYLANKKISELKQSSKGAYARYPTTTTK